MTADDGVSDRDPCDFLMIEQVVFQGFFLMRTVLFFVTLMLAIKIQASEQNTMFLGRSDMFLWI